MNEELNNQADTSNGTEPPSTADKDKQETANASAKPSLAAAKKKTAKPKQKKKAEEVLLNQIQQLTDTNLRLQAEVQNITRRAAMEVEKAHKFGLENLVRALIETVDNLEKSLISIADNMNQDNPVYQGVQLTHQSLMTTLKKFGVKTVDPQGEAFDPSFHEALGRIPSPDHKANQVVVVVEKGYMLHDRLLRPAKVQIAE